MYDNIEPNIYAELIRKNLREWSRLMARTHYTLAKSIGAHELYGYIKEKYGVKKNRRSTLSDGAIYSSAELLGENFEDIDAALTEIYFEKRPVTVRYERSSKCISRIISDMPCRARYSQCGKFKVPKRRIRLTDRIVHNAFLYKLGMLLFKKGSKVRAFLKKRL
jgi:hypothetical protein